MIKTAISPPTFAAAKREKLLEHTTYNSDAENLITRIPKAETRLNDASWLAENECC